jgi:hypothetical protein
MRSGRVFGEAFNAIVFRHAHCALGLRVEAILGGRAQGARF